MVRKASLVLAAVLMVMFIVAPGVGAQEKKFHNDAYSRSVIISAPEQAVWDVLKDPAGLPAWVPGIKETVIVSETKEGVGTVREITLDDGLLIEEHFVAWKERSSVSYIMVKGFPLRGYFATMAMQPLSDGAVLFTWSVYYTTQEMTDEEFKGFGDNLRAFFEGTLQNLKTILEK